MADESHFRLRIPADLKAKIEQIARASGRSLNAQVLWTLQLAMDQAGELEELREQVDRHEQDLKEVWIHIETLQAAASSLLADHAPEALGHLGDIEKPLSQRILEKLQREIKAEGGSLTTEKKRP